VATSAEDSVAWLALACAGRDAVEAAVETEDELAPTAPQAVSVIALSAATAAAPARFRQARGALPRKGQTAQRRLR